MANILLVDNSEDLNEVLSIFLELKGFSVKTALSEVKAQEAFALSVPDLILLEVMIKWSDGRKICKEIKQNYGNSIRIILLSSSPKLLEDYQLWKADGIYRKTF